MVHIMGRDRRLGGTRLSLLPAYVYPTIGEFQAATAEQFSTLGSHRLFAVRSREEFWLPAQDLSSSTVRGEDLRPKSDNSRVGPRLIPAAAGLKLSASKTCGPTEPRPAVDIGQVLVRVVHCRHLGFVVGWIPLSLSRASVRLGFRGLGFRV